MPRRSRSRKFLGSLGFVCLFNGCGPTKCARNIEQWIDEAPTALNQFLEIREEVLAHRGFCQEQAVQGDLFLREMDTAEYAKHDLPKLMSWFRAGKGYIAIEDEYTAFCYRECEVGRYSAHGRAYFRRMQHQYKSVVVVVDSTDLGNGWYAHVTMCTGCGD